MNCPSGEICSPLISTSPKNKFLSMIGGCSARTVSGATRIASVEAKRTSVFIFHSRTTTAILLIPPSFLTLYAEPRILYLLNVVGRTLTRESQANDNFYGIDCLVSVAKRTNVWKLFAIRSYRSNMASRIFVQKLKVYTSVRSIMK